MKLNKFVYFALITLAFAGLACQAATGSVNQQLQVPQVPAENQSTTLPTWQGEDGYAVKNDSTTPRYSVEVGVYARAHGFNVVDHGSWQQATKGSLTVSWAEFGPTKMGNVDGIYSGKYILVAQRDYMTWVSDMRITHFTCGGSFLRYQTNMADWDITPSTLVQFDGPYEEIVSFVNGFTQYWVQIRKDLGGCTP